MSAAPTGRFVEHVPEYDVSGVLANAPDVRGGEVVLPDGPGHWYRVSEGARREFAVPFD